MEWTKENRAKYKKKWQEENKEHVKQYRRDYYLKSKLNDKPKKDTEVQNESCNVIYSA